MASGARTYIALQQETNWGVKPVTPNLQSLNRLSGDGIASNRAEITDDTIRSDRQVAESRLGNLNPSISLNQNLRYGEADDILSGGLGSAWDSVTSGSVSVDIVASAGTITRSSGSFVTDGFEVGDWVKVAGATNSGFFKVTDVVALVITIDDPSGELVDSTAESVTITSSSCVNGSDLKSFTFEEGYEDASTPFYLLTSGQKVATMSIGVAVEAPATFNTTWQGKSYEINDAQFDAPANASGNSILVGVDGVASIGGGSTCIITDISLDVNNNLDPNFCAFSQEAGNIVAGRSMVTGSATLYINDKSFISKFVNEETFRIDFMLKDVDGNAYAFVIPYAKITSESRSIPENSITQQISFMAIGTELGYSILVYR